MPVYLFFCIRYKNDFTIDLNHNQIVRVGYWLLMFPTHILVTYIASYNYDCSPATSKIPLLMFLPKLASWSVLSLFLSQLEVNTSFMVAPVFFLLATVSSGTSTTRLHLTLTSNFRAGGFDPAALGVRPGPQKGLFFQIYLLPRFWKRGLCNTFVEMGWNQKMFYFQPMAGRWGWPRGRRILSSFKFFHK